MKRLVLKSIIAVALVFLLPGCLSFPGLGMSDTAFLVAIRDGDIETVKDGVRSGKDVNGYQGGDLPLIEAALECEPEIAEFLLDNGADINKANDYGVTALMCVVDSRRDNCDPAKSDKLVELLLSRGADVGMVTSEGYSAFDLAFRSGSRFTPAHVARLIEYGADLHGQETDSLYSAAAGGATEIVAALLKRGVSPNSAVDYGDKYPLLAAASAGHADTVAQLINSGADLNIKLENGKNAIYYAIVENEPEIARMLLEAGADPNQRIDGKSLLFRSTGHEETTLAALLLEFGADPENGSDDENPLERAVWNRNAAMVEYLLANGADPDGLDEYGKTIFGQLCSNGYKDLAIIFIKAGADVNKRNRFDDYRPLYYAVYSGDTETVGLLLKNGADLDYRWSDDYGNTALHQAAYAGRTEIVKLLLDYGADKSIKRSHDGKTALDLAKYKKYFRIEEMLN